MKVHELIAKLQDHALPDWEVVLGSGDFEGELPLISACRVWENGSPVHAFGLYSLGRVATERKRRDGF